MSKKTLPYIEVITHQIGYGLKFEGMKSSEGYMYFTPEKLLEGFMMHIGLGMTDQLNTETITDFLVTAINWRENKDCVKEIERLNASLKMMTSRRNALAKKMIQERNRLITLLEELKSLKAHFKDNPEVKKAADKLLKQYKGEFPRLTLQSLGVTKKDLEAGDTKDEEEDDDE